MLDGGAFYLGSIHLLDVSIMKQFDLERRNIVAILLPSDAYVDTTQALLSFLGCQGRSAGVYSARLSRFAEN